MTFMQSPVHTDALLLANNSQYDFHIFIIANIVGCYILRPFAHPVACCCVLLGVVAESLKPDKQF